MLFMAIASHKLISGLALSSRFLKEGATTRQVGRSPRNTRGWACTAFAQPIGCFALHMSQGRKD